MSTTLDRVKAAEPDQRVTESDHIRAKARGVHRRANLLFASYDAHRAALKRFGTSPTGRNANALGRANAAHERRLARMAALTGVRHVFVAGPAGERVLLAGDSLADLTVLAVEGEDAR